MNYNKFVKFPNLNEEFNDRAKLDTGTLCNYKCNFCYYIDKLNINTSFDIIKNRIDYLIKSGVKEIDISGGESSIHKDWFKILKYCADNDFKISTLSNGSMFKDLNFLMKSKELGLREILFSIHGNEDYHDKVVNKKGAFKHILKAIDNSLNSGLKVRVNCVVTEETTLDFLLYLDKRISQINFLPINYWSASKGKNDFISICNKIIPYVNNLKDYFEINVRYVPFCYMPDHIEFIKDIYQHLYDKTDWNKALYDYKIDPDEYKKDKKKYMFAAAKEKIMHFYKPKECYKCKHFNVCDGVKYKEQEVFPIAKV